jgi:hypothetical protein
VPAGGVAAAVRSEPSRPPPSGWHCLPGAGHADRDYLEAVRGGQHRRTTTNPPRHPAARACPLGVQQQVPALVEQLVQVAAVLRRTSPLAVDRRRVEDQRHEPRGGPVAVEVVSRRGDHGALAQPPGERREDHRGVQMAGVIGDQNHRTLERGELVPARRAAARIEVHHRVQDEAHEVLAGQAGGSRARPRDVELGGSGAQLAASLRRCASDLGDAALPGALATNP